VHVQSIGALCTDPDGQDFMFILRTLRLLRELDRADGTVIATAQALHLAPPAVSQQLAGLAARRDPGRIAD
jgi:hypothetical protein